MIREYIQSTEEYKGFVLEIHMTALHDMGHYHRTCEVFRDGKRIGIGKTKKECKELIDGGYLK